MKYLRHPHAAAILIPAILVLMARILFQGFIFPTELSGDEAQYWDWSRDLQLSYYTKGPGVTLIIAFFTSFLGDVEFGVRLGSYLAHALTAVVIGILGSQFSGGSTRVVWLTSIGFQCVLGYQIGGSLMTVDMPMVLGWSLATVCAVRVVPLARENQSVFGSLTLMGAALGFSFLAKYTALLAVAGLLIGLWPWRKVILAAPRARQGVWLGSSLFLSGIAPVLIWNAQHGWPAIQHLLGHIAVPGGDSGTVSWTEFQVEWPVNYLLQVLALPGPLLAITMGFGIVAWKRGQLDRPLPELRVALCSAPAAALLPVGVLQGRDGRKLDRRSRRTSVTLRGHLDRWSVPKTCHDLATRWHSTSILSHPPVATHTSLVGPADLESVERHRESRKDPALPGPGSS